MAVGARGDRPPARGPLQQPDLQEIRFVDVLECAAVLDVCRIRGVGSPAQLEHGRELLLRLVQMLTRLARAG